jgi:hypothetical protein
MGYKSFLLSLCLLISTSSMAQQAALVSGLVLDASNNQPIELVTVFVKGSNIATSTDENGRFSLKVPANQRHTVGFKRVAYKETTTNIVPLNPSAEFEIEISLAPSESTLEVVIRERRLEDAAMIRNKNIKDLRLIPSTTGNLESVLPHLALGTNTGTGGELSSQYQVRGGNYDENLVYVNDFEIYRPQLIRAGQQEGLTFPNMDLIRDLSFSSGGFQAKYGDKLSSVLEVKYKRPDSLRASASASLLGASAHLEGLAKMPGAGKSKLRYLVGTRYKTTRLLLGSLDLKGEYLPDFTDLQAYITYDVNTNWQLGFLGNFNRSVYRFQPQSLSRAFGLIDYALQIRTAFDGQEIDDFTQAMGGLSLTFLPQRKHNPLYHKWIVSSWKSWENERFDILGYYVLGELDTNLGSDNFGEIVNILGTGTQQTWVRNYLTVDVRNFEYKGGIELQNDVPKENLMKSNFLQWSTKWQIEHIDDYINEWERLDSALYSLPFDTSQLLVRKTLKTRNQLQSNRFSFFVQDTWTWRKEGVHEWQIVAGARGQYWNMNKEWFLTPRGQIIFKPLNTNKDITWKLASGLYYQPAFYRELRAPNGSLNRAVKAQKAAHLVGGFTFDFLWGKRRPVKMRLITEAYYKKMWDMVSYDLDNVRIRYAGFNDSKGYSTGFDMRLNGAFVEGAESWINLSFLRTRESLYGIQHKIRSVGQKEGTNVNDVPRPTDRLMNLSMFFQDHLRKNKNIKTHLNLTVGTGLPFGIPDNNLVYRNNYRFKPYHRVDIGFGFQLYKEAWKRKFPHHPLKFTKDAWASLEVFNLLQVSNEASNIWIKAINNIQYAIPNYLTGRRINLRVKMDF